MGDELATNANMLEIIKTIAETYDTGDKESVYTKGKEFRSKEIKSVALSSLFVGSPTYLLYDPSVRKKFLIAFGSKLARRSYFCYIPEEIEEPTYSSISEMKEAKKRLRDDSLRAREKMSAGVVALTEHQLQKKNELLQLSEEVFDLFETYKRYNYEVAKTTNHKHPLSKLVREHLQWKALKLAGAFAIFRMSDTVEAKDYIYAIRFCESLDTDMSNFEAELVKEQYELFADYMQSISVDGKSDISIHDLKKLGYITGTGSPIARIKELVFLTSSYDKKGIYTYTDQGISYEQVKPTNHIQLSFLPVDNTPIFKSIEGGDSKEIEKAKGYVASTANGPLQTADIDFKTLANMLTKDYAYSPFLYRDNKRGKDNVISGTKFVVLDVDKSDITASEAHFILQDINHHIALSSDASNEFKFRILIELDAVVDLPPQTWKYFFLSVAESLSLNVDPLPQSQLFFSYSGRDVLSVTDKSPLPVRDHVMLANDKANTKTPVIEKALTNPQKQALLSDELSTFDFAFECTENGSLNLIRAAKYAKDLGMPKEEIIELMHRINDYWMYPMDDTRLQNTIISQIQRW